MPCSPMPPIRKAIVPMAGRATRLYPLSIVLPKGLLPFVLPDNTLTTGLQLIVEPLLEAGIEQVGIVVSPDTTSIYESFLSGDVDHFAPLFERKPLMHAHYQRLQRIAGHITLLSQDKPYGLGHAIWCGRDFAENEPVLVVLGDHIPTDGARTFQHALQTYEQLNAPLYTVHTVPLSKVCLYGILQGEPTNAPNLYRLHCLIEKPTPDVAQAQLRTVGLPEDQFFAHHGIYLFPPRFWEVQEQIAESYDPQSGEWQLVHAQQRLLDEMPAYLLCADAPSLDFGTAEEYRHAFLTIAQEGLHA